MNRDTLRIKGGQNFCKLTHYQFIDETIYAHWIKMAAIFVSTC